MTTLKQFLQDNLFLKNGTCPICGKVLFYGDAYCCPTCLRDLPLNGGPTCQLCGRGLSDHKKSRCCHCIEEAYPFSGGYAHLHYSKGGKKIIAALKFNNRPHLGTWLGQMIDISAIPWLDQVDLLVPIPIHEKRYRERGYNQSDYLARGIFNKINQIHQADQRQANQKNAPQLMDDNLIRSLNTAHQVGQGQKKRRDNIHGAFDLVNPHFISGKRILLIDDVLTTGATLGEAARTLIDGGAGQVYVLTIAALRDG